MILGEMKFFLAVKLQDEKEILMFSTVHTADVFKQEKKIEVEKCSKTESDS